MNPQVYTGGFVQTNGYLLTGPDGPLLIDAPAGVSTWLSAKGVTPVACILTHQHFDHVEDAAILQAAGIPLYAFAPYSRELTLEAHARDWGLPISVTPYTIDHLFDLSQPLTLAGFTLHLAHLPGHATDSVIFYLPTLHLVFSGDTLFASGLGRYDLPGGSLDQLLKGIDQHLLTLPDETLVFPGHGPSTTIEEEKLENIYLQ